MSDSSPKKVLVVDDEAGIRFGLREFLESKDWRVAEAASVAAGVRAFLRERPDVVLLDYALPDGNGLEALERFQAADPSVPVAMLTGLGSIELAVQAVKAGADQFLTKPVDLGALEVLLRRILDGRRALRREEAGRRTHAALDPFRQGLLEPLRGMAARLGQVASPVLILGETGTGKGVLARWLHDHGARSAEAFVDLNCAGLSRELMESELFGHEKGAFTGAHQRKQGLLELAHRGTLFLDEIGDLDPAIQAKLLKVVEEKRFRRVGDVKEQMVDVRILAATHQPLEELVEAGRFRRDLYYRLAAHVLRIPPLRERLDDLEALVQELMTSLCRELGRPRPALHPQCWPQLRAQPWPGNVRELKNALERALMHSAADPLRFCEHCLEPARPNAPPPPPGARLAEREWAHIQAALAEHNGNISAAARALGISRSTLYERLRRAR